MLNDCMPLVVILGFLYLAVGGYFAWRLWILKSEPIKQKQELEQYQQRFRQWRNQRAEAVMVECLKELGWPKAAKKMTAEEVSRQLCNRLADRLWNRPNDD